MYAVIQATFRCTREGARLISESISKRQIVLAYIVNLAVARSRTKKKGGQAEVRQPKQTK